MKEVVLSEKDSFWHKKVPKDKMPEWGLRTISSLELNVLKSTVYRLNYFKMHFRSAHSKSDSVLFYLTGN